MIHRVKFENFKALRNVEITFDERLTVLVGPNGCGKSSVLQGVQVLAQSADDGDLAQVFTGPSEFGNLMNDVEGGQFLLEADCGEAPDISRFRIRGPTNESGPPSKDTQVKIGKRSIRLIFEWMNIWDGKEARVGGPSRLLDNRSFLISSRLVRFAPDRLAAPSVVRSVSPIVDQDGSGLASALKTIHGAQPDRFRTIVSAFRRIIPSVKSVRFGLVERNGSGPEKRILDQILIDFMNANEVPAPAISDGTLYVLGLLTAIFGAPSPKILLCDDLDHGLHPKAQMELIRVLRELMNEVPDLQIIATSHSLYVLSELPENSIRVLTLGPDGGAVCGRLSDHPDYEAWKEAMTPGEFWSHVGEDWLLKREPLAAQ